MSRILLSDKGLPICTCGCHSAEFKFDIVHQDVTVQCSLRCHACDRFVYGRAVGPLNAYNNCVEEWKGDPEMRKSKKNGNRA